MKWLLATVLLMLVTIPVAKGSTELEKFFELTRIVDQNEPKQKWKKINWQPDINSAMKEAQKANKPILVFMLVNEQGKSDADHC